MPNEHECEKQALKLLAKRALSENELRQHLTSQNHTSEVIDIVIGNFRQCKYLDDEALGQNLFAKYTASGKYGINGIIARLKNRGLTPHSISHAVRDYVDNNSYQSALTLVSRRYRRIQPGDCAKIGRFLAARGFTPNTIRKVLDHLMESIPE